MAMKARTHDAAAVAGLIAVTAIVAPQLPQLSLATVVVAFLANQLGGIAPDIDQPTAPFWRNLPIGGVVGRTIARMLGGHRFLTHSLLGMALVGWLFWLLLAAVHPITPSLTPEIIWWAFMIGMFSHLIMDSFTKEGVPWLLPIPLKFGFPPVRKLRITTGKWVEEWVVFPVLVVVILLLLFASYQEIYGLIRHLIR